MTHPKWSKAGIMAVLLLAGGLFLYRGLAADEGPRVSFVPAEIDEVLVNPYTGFAVDARSASGSGQQASLAHANVTWRELEPVKGMVDFEAFEDKIHLESWKQKGVKLILRLVLDYPTSQRHMDIPDWLYEETGKAGSWYDTDFGHGFSPDYSNPDLIRYHAKLVQALGQRYNADPAIAFVQLGSLGHWGEWHTWEEGEQRIPFPKHSVTDQYAEAYVEAFPDKQLMMRRPHDVALRNGMGLFNDAFGKKESTVDGFLRWYTEGYTSWLTLEEEPAMPDFWAHAPSGGEFAHESAYLEDNRIEETIRQARLTHVTYMGPQAPYREKEGGRLQKNIDRFLRTIGYRFVITEESHEETARPGDTLTIGLKITNRGVAPFYYDWPLELSLSDPSGQIVASARADADIKDWLPGKSEASAGLRVPADSPTGVYTVNAAILDPATGKPGIAFANDGKRPDGRYELGTVTIRAAK